jgi:hypothetical protein
MHDGDVQSAIGASVPLYHISAIRHIRKSSLLQMNDKQYTMVTACAVR